MKNVRSILILSALFAVPATAAIITVDAACSLVDAIHAANDDAATGGCPAGDGADEIHLATDVSLDEIDHSNFSDAFGTPAIESKITIVGHGHLIERQRGGPPMTLLQVSAPGELAVISTALSRAADVGRAISRDRSTPLTLINSTFSGNCFSAVYFSVFDEGPAGTFTVRNSRFYDGGIGLDQGNLSVRDSRFAQRHRPPRLRPCRTRHRFPFFLLGQHEPNQSRRRRARSPQHYDDIRRGSALTRRPEPEPSPASPLSTSAERRLQYV